MQREVLVPHVFPRRMVEVEEKNTEMTQELITSKMYHKEKLFYTLCIARIRPPYFEVRNIDARLHHAKLPPSRAIQVAPHTNLAPRARSEHA